MGAHPIFFPRIPKTKKDLKIIPQIHTESVLPTEIHVFSGFIYLFIFEFDELMNGQYFCNSHQPSPPRSITLPGFLFYQVDTPFTWDPRFQAQKTRQNSWLWWTGSTGCCGHMVLGSGTFEGWASCSPNHPSFLRLPLTFPTWALSLSMDGVINRGFWLGSLHLTQWWPSPSTC